MTEADTDRGTHHHGEEGHRAALKSSLTAMDVTLSEYAFETAYARVATAARRSGEVSQAQMRAIIDDVLSTSEILQGVAETFR